MAIFSVKYFITNFVYKRNIYELRLERLSKLTGYDRSNLAPAQKEFTYPTTINVTPPFTTPAAAFVLTIFTAIASPGFKPNCGI